MTTGFVLLGVFGAVCAIQMCYYLFVFNRVATHQASSRQQRQHHPVSVIICARDEAHNLERNLPAILEQAYRSSFEVMVVNDNSIDDSKFILEQTQKRYRGLKVVTLNQEAKGISGKKFPLSIGIKEAQHEIVLLTDADCTPASQNWVYHMQDAFAPGKEVVLGYGAYQKAPGLLNKIIRFETFHTALQYFGYALAGMPYMGVGRNLAYKKDLFFRNKGFAPISGVASGDDDLFVNRVATKTNTAVVLEREAFTFSEPKKTWRDWRRQKQRHYTTGKYYKATHKFLLGLYSLTQALLYPLLAVCILFADWRWALLLFGIRLAVQGWVWQRTMKRLGEEDLFPLFPLWDLWMFFYYIIFAPALWTRPRKEWR